MLALRSVRWSVHTCTVIIVTQKLCEVWMTEVWMTIVESGWNLWVWLVGIVSGCG